MALFDTGRNGAFLMANLAKMKIDPKSIDTLILSHAHEDHIGGVSALVESHSHIKVYPVKSFSDGFKKSLGKLGASVVEVDQPCAISPNCVSTGELKSFVRNEQSLLLLTDQGVIVITGCAHPGIIDIIERAKHIFDQQVLLVMGGFHLLYDNSWNTRKIALRMRELGVRHVAPSHCSGSEAVKSFAEVFGERLIVSGAGRVIRVKDIL